MIAAREPGPTEGIGAEARAAITKKMSREINVNSPERLGSMAAARVSTVLAQSLGTRWVVEAERGKPGAKLLGALAPTVVLARWNGGRVVYRATVGFGEGALYSGWLLDPRLALARLADMCHERKVAAENAEAAIREDLSLAVQAVSP